MLQKRQAVYRVRKDRVYPFRLAKNKQNLDIIGQMLESIQDSIGEKKSNVEENLQYFARQIWQPKVAQAVIKLLIDKAIFEEDKTQQAMDIREQVFENSQKFWSQLKGVPTLEEISTTILRNTFQEVPKFTTDLLYRDLPANQNLQKFETTTPENFVDWADLCMARALLLQATSITLVFYSSLQNLRAFMRYLKFFGLLFEVTTKQDHWELLIEGPESILESSRSYGINFCNLLPAILLIEGAWEMTAKVQLFEKKNYRLILVPEDNYKSFYKKENFLRQKRIDDFVSTWDQKSNSAKISQQVFSLEDNIYLLPDVEMTSNKKKYYFEWVQYPLGNIEFLKKKIQASPPDYFFLIIGSKKKFLTVFEKLIQEKKMICFAKNFIQSKLEDAINRNKDS